ncbi:MAG: penicillin-binding protein 1B [Gammaproteobacteria bacterium]|nr:penicillin-binding protein 1B [Gammaproteobacteria bacterium]MBU2059655.1 penicillin-binding protein 1B [Gammaproteobacteria bacterium]MBU2176090.1 penicillin-binding protein 1B [Gammaproteobacteria bacterium]MBU2245278.1 penicillin-binding protein 1B [Gammaproteobacteria bacterium]MBU2343864.1 penicillin-binding protein 1B [Gammaproteobacteria bacterium]
MTQKQSRTPRKKPVAKTTKGSVFARQMLWLGLKVGLVLLLTLFIYLIYLDSKITTLFSGHKWQFPAQVYARSLELIPGKSLTQKQLVSELDLLQYRAVDVIKGPGQYSQNGDKVVVFRRAFQFADGYDQEEAFTVSFAGQRVHNIYDHQLKKSVQKARIEPQLVQHLVSSAREDREMVVLADLPEHIKDALLTIEDRDFYQHHGVSIWSVMRAFWANLQAGRTVQGGSTLTQQLAKNMYLTSEQTLIRKVNEALIALILDYRYSKDQILEAYLNEIFIGQFHNNAVHGFALGSKFYFGKPLNELLPEEYALLVAIVKGPSYYDPRRFGARAKSRRDLVLSMLRNEKLLSEAEYTRAVSKPLAVIPMGHHLKGRSPSYLDAVKRELKDLVTDQATIESGIKIFTYMDPQAQLAAEHTVKQRLSELDDKLEAAMVVTDYQTGSYKAIVGGKAVHFAGYNRALDARRQIGSIVKPVLYLQALAKPNQFSLATMLDDSPIHLKGNPKSWSPQNFDKKFRGQVTLLQALSESLNVPTVRLGLKLGLPALKDGFQRLGLERELKLQPSAFLGAVELTPAEVAQLYQVIANKGRYIKLASIESITKTEGTMLYQRRNIVQQRVTEEADYLLQYAMQQSTRSGTAKTLANQFGVIRFAGKTGTSSDHKDSWFTGFEHESSVTIWLGRDDNKSIGLTGGSGALTLFSQYFKMVPPNSLFRAVPPDVTLGRFSVNTGRAVAAHCDGTLLLPKVVSGTLVTDCE